MIPPAAEAENLVLNERLVESSRIPKSTSSSKSLVQQHTPLLSLLKEELHYLGKFGIHALQQIYNGVLAHNEIRQLPTREDWRIDNTITSRCIRGLIDFSGHSIARSRNWSKLVPYLIPWKVHITPFKFNINLDMIIEKESKHNEFPIPPEINNHHTPNRSTSSKTKQPYVYSLEGEWVNYTDKPSNRVILYFHGGAYFTCNAKTHRQLTWRYAHTTNSRIFVVNYRLAPEHPFPAAIHDAYASWLYLTNPYHEIFQYTTSTSSTTTPQNNDNNNNNNEKFFFNQNYPIHHPIPPENITIMGDSAGGGICMSLLSYLKDYIYSPTLPKCCILISPWVDLTCSSESWKRNGDTDYLFPIGDFFCDTFHIGSRNPVYWYTVGRRPHLTWISDKPEDKHDLEYAHTITSHPLVSPLFIKDMTGLPPILIQAGDAEVLCDESLYLAQKISIANPGLKKQGLIRHELYKHSAHVFPIFVWTDASVASFKNVGKFIQKIYGIESSSSSGSSSSGSTNMSDDGFEIEDVADDQANGVYVKDFWEIDQDFPTY